MRDQGRENVRTKCSILQVAWCRVQDQVAVGLYVFAGNPILTSGIQFLTTAMRGLTTFLLLYVAIRSFI